MPFTKEDAQKIHARRLSDVDQQLREGLALYGHEMHFASAGIGGLAIVVILFLFLYRYELGSPTTYAAGVLSTGLAMAALLHFARRTIRRWIAELGEQSRKAYAAEYARFEQELDRF